MRFDVGEIMGAERFEFLKSGAVFRRDCRVYCLTLAINGWFKVVDTITLTLTPRRPRTVQQKELCET